MINVHWVDTDITSNMHRLIEMNDVPTMIRVLEEVSEFFRGRTRRGWMLSSKKVSHLFVCLFCLSSLKWNDIFPTIILPFFFTFTHHLEKK